MGAMGSSVMEVMAVTAETGKTYINSLRVRARYGGASDMWLWRQLTDPDSEFPKPIIISGRRFWDQAELDAWDAKQPRWQPPEPIDKSKREFNEGNPVKERRAKAAAKAIKRTKKDEGQVAANGEEPELPLG
jgi:predicted DNA-binding transcriptional regulator AlpA